MGRRRFRCINVESPPPSETIIYFECDDLDAVYEELRTQGIVFDQAPADQPWFWREAYLSDPDGNVLCLYYAGSNRRFPPWRITSR
ncbi:MAG: VOC family protein [Steroidobacteraceae bacterium]|jgi:uncharacterized glyoxalase superfamily protein PhnB